MIGEKRKTKNLITTGKRLSLVLCLFLGLFALYLTKKRIFILCFVLSTLVVSVIQGMKERTLKKKLVLFFLIGLLLGIVSYQIPQGKESIDRFFNNTSSDYFSGRMQLWRQSIDLFLRKPFFGWGWFSTVDILKIGGRGEVPHNTYIEILVETGVVGFFAYLFILGFYSWQTIRIIKRNSMNFHILCAICTQVIFLVWSITENPVWDEYPFYLYLLTYPILRANSTKIQMEPSKLASRDPRFSFNII
jgi:O-antigen ligase